MIKKILIFTLLTIFSFSSTINATELLNDEEPKNTKVYVGGGFFYKPTYEGSSSRRSLWIPVAGIKYEDRTRNFFNAFNFYGPQASLTIFNNNEFKFDFFAEYEFGRQNGDDNSLRILEEIDPHFSVGTNIEYSLPYDFSISYEFQTDVDDFYSESYTSDFAINYNKNIWITFTQPLVNTTSFSTSYANSDYLNEWFGTPANEMYKYYKPSSDFYKMSLSNSLIMPFSEKIVGVIDFSYDRLIGEAADSQLIKKQASPNQFSFMFTVMYEFYSF